MAALLRKATMSNLSFLPEDVRAEFTINEQGQAFASRRAIARLAGVEDSSIVRLLQKLSTARTAPKRLEKLAGQSFEGAAQIPDTVASQIIGYYALDAGRYCTEQAKRVYKAFAAIGFRSWVQNELGWQQPQIKLPMSYGEALMEAAKQRLEVERLESENKLLEQTNEQLSEAVDELFNYSSIVRIAKFNNVHESQFKWHKLKSISEQMGIEIKKVPDARYMTKNLYSHDVWRVAYPHISLPETTTLVIRQKTEEF